MGPSVTRIVKFLRRGASVSRADVEYAKSSSNTTAPTSGWQTTAPAWENGKYIWTRTHTFYDDGSSTYSIPVCLPSGKGISSIIEQYYLSDSATQLIGGSWSATAPTWQDGKYIWTRSLITYTDNSTVTTSPVCATGHKGDKGDTGVGISSITEYYLATSASSGVTRSTSGWTTTIQSLTSSNKYLWNYEKVTKTDGTESYTDPHIIGVYGDTGNTGGTGPQGVGISSITEYYLATSASSGVTRSTSGWTTTVQSTTATNKYLWNYEKIVYTNNTTAYTDPRIIGTYGDKGDKGDTGETGPQGSRGPALRGPQAWNDCATGYAFKQGAEGEAYVDVVLYNGYYYVCKKSHTKSSTNYPGSSADQTNGYWQLGDSVDLIATKVLLAANAIINFAQTNQILVMKSDGTTVALGLGGGNYPLWIGAPTATNAPFKVDIDGKMRAMAGEFKGGLYSPYQTLQINQDRTLDLPNECCVCCFGAASGNPVLSVPTPIAAWNGLEVRIMGPYHSRLATYNYYVSFGNNSLYDLKTGNVMPNPTFRLHNKELILKCTCFDFAGYTFARWYLTNPEHFEYDSANQYWH